MEEIVTTTVNALTGYVTGSASAIGDGLSTLLFVTNETSGAIESLTPAGGVIFTMTGIGFACGIMGIVFGLFRRRG